uniref:Uncharacterized protein n=1 Tax=Arundo donax TaxID=35708 RepID=A0A0A9GYU2_ARUDO
MLKIFLAAYSSTSSLTSWPRIASYPFSFFAL